MASVAMGKIFGTEVTFNPDTIKPEESTVRFYEEGKKYENEAILNIRGEVLKNDGFSPDEIHSWKAYVSNHRAAFMKIIREA